MELFVCGKIGADVYKRQVFVRSLMVIRILASDRPSVPDVRESLPISSTLVTPFSFNGPLTLSFLSLIHIEMCIRDSAQTALRKILQLLQLHRTLLHFHAEDISRNHYQRTSGDGRKDAS